MDFKSFEEELERLDVAVFTVRDAARITGTKDPAYCRLFLSRLASRGRILRIERGKYCTRHADPLEVASNLVFPSYVSFMSALAFHKLTTQIPVEIQIACSRQKKPLEFGNNQLVFAKLKDNALFGFRHEGNATVAEPEKAVIDGLYMPEKMPASEAFHAIKEGRLDAKKLEDYARRLDSTVVAKRLGFLMELAGLETTALKPRPNTKTDLLNTRMPARGTRSRKWRLLINEVIDA